MIQHPEIAASVEGRLRSPGDEAESADPVETSANGVVPQSTDSVADILSGAAPLEELDDEELDLPASAPLMSTPPCDGVVALSMLAAENCFVPRTATSW